MTWQIGKTTNTNLQGTGFPVGPLKTQTTGETQAAGAAKKITTVDMQPNKSIERKDLDNLSPYAGLVNISKRPQAGSVESYAAAAPEFGIWQGNFTINNKQEAVDYLSAYNTALKTYSQVAPHMQDKTSPFAELYA